MGYKILVADDHPATRELLRRALHDRGHDVLLAENGAEALTAIRAQHPDLVLLDVLMPELDGRDVCRQVKGDKELRDTLVVMLSGRADHHERLLGLELGADDYVGKPFRVSWLVRRAEFLIEKERRQRLS